MIRNILHKKINERFRPQNKTSERLQPGTSCSKDKQLLHIARTDSVTGKEGGIILRGKAVTCKYARCRIA